MPSTLIQDRIRYENSKIPRFQKYYRLSQNCSSRFLKSIFQLLFKIEKKRNLIELSSDCRIGGGLYFGHPYCITINPDAIIGHNVNIHRGVVIGQENRGKRRSVPTIGNAVWVGINAVIVGNITIGNDVLIAPNSYVNCDVPSHSIVLGNPCRIIHKENATAQYIVRLS